MAGLDQCDLRFSYGNFLTSTPTKARVCRLDNLECWEQGDNDASKIPAGATAPPLTESGSDSDSSEPNTDNSYGGQWSKIPKDSLAQALDEMDTDDSYGGHWNPVHINPPTSTTIFPEEVLTDDEGPACNLTDSPISPIRRMERPHVDSLLLPPHGEPFSANLNRNDQVQYKFTKHTKGKFVGDGPKDESPPPPGFWTGNFVTKETKPTPMKKQSLITSLISGK